MSHKKPGTVDRAKSLLVVKALEKAVTPGQVRILMALANGCELTRIELAAATSLAPKAKPTTGVASSDWDKILWRLCDAKLIRIDEYEPENGERAKHVHTITALGSKLLERGLEKAKALPAPKAKAPKTKAK